MGTSGSGKSFSWPATCNGQSTHGGVFWKDSADANYVNGITTSLFMALSAHLYDLVGDQKYFDGANNAKDYIKAHLLRASDSLILDGMNIQTCEKTDWTFTYNQGKVCCWTSFIARVTETHIWLQFIEASAILYSKSGNVDYLNDALVSLYIACASSDTNVLHQPARTRQYLR